MNRKTKFSKYLSSLLSKVRFFDLISGIHYLNAAVHMDTHGNMRLNNRELFKRSKCKLDINDNKMNEKDNSRGCRC